MHRHAIRPNHSTRTPSTHIIVDCESRVIPDSLNERSQAQELRIWCACRLDFSKGKCYKRRWEEGTTGEQWWDYLKAQLSDNRAVWVWAHGGQSDYTWLGLWQELDAGRWHIKKLCLGHPPLILDLTCNGRTAKLLDSLNFWRCRVRDLGAALDVPKLPLPRPDAPESEWRKYCRRDVDIVAQSIEALVTLTKTESLGQMRTTAPGQAYASWRHTHKGKFPIIHDEPAVVQVERDAYYGGWGEVFWKGVVRADKAWPGEQADFEKENGATLWGQRIHVLDARGFYPSVMRGREYPWKLIARCPGLTVAQLDRTSSWKSVITQAHIESNADTYPLRREGKTQMTRGSFWTTLATPEIRWALERGHIKATALTLVYEQADLFTVWVEKMWALRKRYEESGNKVWENMVKVLMNSLFGKFGQRSKDWEKHPDHPVRQRWGEWIECDGLGGNVQQFRAIAGMVEQRQPKGEWEHAFVSIPAHVTSWGRVMLREWLEILPPQSVYYCDTDCVHVSDAGLTALKAKGYLDRDDLGGLRLEGTYLYAEYKAQKLYRLEDTITAAGIPRDAVPGQKWSWTYQLWESIRELINRGPATDIRIREVMASAQAGRLGLELRGDGWQSPPVVDDTIVPF